MARIKPELIIFASFLTTALVIGNAFYHKKQFYPSVVHITKSNGSMAVLYFQALVFAIIVGKLMNKLFFGELRAVEMEHLYERSWFALTETCLAFTVFRDDFSPKFMTMFTILFFLKCFHWLSEDRVDYMERSPNISALFHVRILVLTGLLALLDAYFVYNAYQYTLVKGASVQIVFGFEYAVLLISLLSTFFKYLLHTIDLQNENPWENKTIYMLYSDLFLGFIRVILYFLFVIIMVKIHTFPLFAIRPIYISLRTFKKCVTDVVQSRRAIRNLNIMYPTVTAEQLSTYADTICIICREEMNAASQIKKLPCDHIFHKNCLRSWFQRQQTCPTCRTSILRYTPTPQQQPQQQAQPQQQPAPQQQQQPQPQAQQAQTQPAGSSAAFGGQPPSTPAANLQQSPFASFANLNDAARFFSSNDLNAPFVPPMSAFPNIMPPFMFPPPPLPELNLSSLTSEQLAELEGDERHNLEARIHCLRNINTLLNGAFVHIQQYMNITMANSHLDNVRGRRTTNVEKDLSFLKTNEKPTTSSAAAAAATTSEATASATASSAAAAVFECPTHTDDDNDDGDSSNETNNGDLNVIRKRRMNHFQSSTSLKEQ